MLRRLVFLTAWIALLATLAAPVSAVAGTSSDALRIARDSRARWSIGAVRLHDKHGRARVQADLLADDVVIARLRLDPKTGALVGEKVYADRLGSEDIPRLRASASRALSRVEVGSWAWPAERGRLWRVPLRYEGRVIGVLTVDVQRSRLIAKGERDDEEGEE